MKFIELLATGVFFFMAAGAFASPDVKKLSVGVIAPITGDYAAIGQGVVNAMQLANTDGSVGAKFDLSVEDNKTCLSPEAVGAFQKLRAQKNIAIIVTVCTAAAQAILPLARQYQIPLLQLTESGDDPEGYMLKFMPSSSGAMQLLGKYFASRFETLAIIADIQPVNVGTGGNVEQLKKSFSEAGKLVVYEKMVNPDLQDFRSLFPNLKKSKAAVVVPILGGASQMATFLKQAEETHLWDTIKLGGNWVFEFLYAELIKLYPKISSLEGLESTNLSQSSSDSFKAQYKERFHEDAPQFADYAYDAAHIIRECGKDQVCALRDRLSASGDIHFDTDKKRVGTFVLKRLRGGVFVVEPSSTLGKN